MPLRLAAAPTAVVVLLVAGLSACTPEQGGPTSTASPATTPSVSVTGSADAGDLRGRLATGLQDSSPANARLVSNPKTTLTPVEAPWLTGWQIVDVENQAPPHPRRFYAGLSPEGRAVVLSGQPEAFSTMLSEAGVSVPSDEVATQVATVFLDATRDFTALSYRVSDADDIRWRPNLTADQEKTRDQVLSEVAGQIGPAAAAREGSGWTVTAWTVTGTDLIRHQLAVGPDGSVTDATETVATDLPVPASI